MATRQGGFPPTKLLLTILVLILPMCSGQGPIVDTSAGRVRGSVVSGVSLFKGIPYGAPPIGNMRFDLPRKAAPWRGVFDATQQGNACIQFFVLQPISLPESEDCLSLDVYVPRDLSRSGNPQLTPLPVLVYVHTGGYVYGSRADFDGTRLARRENMIVIAMNYRLGVLGFLALNDSDIPGNVGLYDQRLAFQWVKENIRAFGGDPDKVVIYGKHPGSWAVSAHILSPLSKGLFSGAIMSSGFYADILYTRAEKAPKTTNVAETLGCDISSPRAVLACLRNQNVRSLVRAYPGAITKDNVFLDGKFIVEQPIHSLQCGRFQRVPVIAGFNTENGLGIVNLFGANLINRQNQRGPTRVEFNITAPFGISQSGIPQSVVDDLIRAVVGLILYVGDREETRLIAGNVTKAFYFTGDTRDRLANLRAALDFTTDIYWLAPLLRLAKYLSRVGVPVYIYEFNERINSNKGEPPAIPMGADPEDDLPFVFGDVEDARRFPLDSTRDKIQFSMDLTAAWSSFVRNGKPSQRTLRGQQLDWKAYTEDDPSYAFLKAGLNMIVRKPLAPKANLVWSKVMGAVEIRKPNKCSALQPAGPPSGRPPPGGSSSTGQRSWFWTYNWSPRGSWWGWWMS